MKTIHSLKLTAMLALAALLAGCVVHEHSIVGGRWHHAPHHSHGPGCGHIFSGGIWIVGP